MRSILYGVAELSTQGCSPPAPAAGDLTDATPQTLADCATRALVRGAGLDELCRIVKDAQLSPVVRSGLAQALAAPTVWPPTRNAFYRLAATQQLIQASMQAAKAEQAFGPSGACFAERFALAGKALSEALPYLNAQCAWVSEHRPLRWSFFGDRDLTPSQRAHERTAQRVLGRSRTKLYAKALQPPMRMPPSTEA